MGSEHTKVRAGIYVEKEILNQADGLLETANVRSRNEFVAEALKFYIGYLLAGKAENYFLQSLASVLTGTIQDSENRLARMDFKIAVELSKLSQPINFVVNGCDAVNTIAPSGFVTRSSCFQRRSNGIMLSHLQSVIPYGKSVSTMSTHPSGSSVIPAMQSILNI